MANSNQKWTKETDKAILSFLSEPSIDIRNSIFDESLHTPFMILSKYLVKRYRRDDWVIDPDYCANDLLSYFIIQMPHYKTGMNGFSYFYVVGMRYLHLKQYRSNRDAMRKVPIESDLYMEQDYELFEEINDSSYLFDNKTIIEENEYKKYLIQEIVIYYRDYHPLVLGKRQLKILKQMESMLNENKPDTKYFECNAHDVFGIENVEAMLLMIYKYLCFRQGIEPRHIKQVSRQMIGDVFSKYQMAYKILTNDETAEFVDKITSRKTPRRK